MGAKEVGVTSDWRRELTPHRRMQCADVPLTSVDSTTRCARGGGGGSRTRVRKIAGERDYRLSPTWNFAVAVKAGQNRRRLVRLISPSAYGPKARGQPTFVTLCPTAVGG